MSCLEDPASVVVAAAIAALLDTFRPDQPCLPQVGATTNVRFFAGDSAPLAAWNSHAAGRGGCKEPFVWVRVMRRYRTASFPSVSTAVGCALPAAIALEMGVGWCALMDEEPKWTDYATEAAVSMDTARRLEHALCRAAGTLTNDADGGHETGMDAILPYGPEGGVIAWTGVFYATY